MPATEQTWRSLKLMHLVFALSALAMLITTIWMMADDHNRAWKDYQRSFRELDVKSTQWRATEQDSADYQRDLHGLEEKLTDSRAQFTAKDDRGVDRFFKAYNDGEAGFAAAADNYKRGSEFPKPLSKKDQRPYQEESAALAARSEAAWKLRGANDPGADAALDQVRKDRQALLKDLNTVMVPVRFREDKLTNELKDKKQVFGQAQSEFDQAVGRNASPERLKTLEDHVEDAKHIVAATTDLNQRTVDERKDLEAALKQITGAEDAAAKDVSDQKAKVDSLKKAADERALTFSRSLLTAPILDAFNSPLKIENRWLPQLPWNNNFRDVARFDRCETCHQGMERSAAGAPLSPAYPPITYLTVDLATPVRPKAGSADSGPPPSDAAAVARVAEVFGLALDTGVFSSDDVTVAAVYPPVDVSKRKAEAEKTAKANGSSDKGSSGSASATASEAEKMTPPDMQPTRAAIAGLTGGDVIEQINGANVRSPSAARGMLLDPVNWGEKDKPKTISLKIRRGVPHPFTTHPRLDLFVGSMSPHPVSKFGCTACHNGQGSATAFKWASHSPDTPDIGDAWGRKYGWFNNENWTYPMFPKRFAESACLKCHHEVVDLDRSRQFPDPPAPKLIDGYTIIRRYGCFGCHEINGFDGPNKRIGPDVRLEPNFSAAASQLLNDKAGLEKLNKDAVAWAEAIVSRPDDDSVRRRLYEVISADAKSTPPVLRDSKRLEGVLKDVDVPGTQRKVGPSLRHVGSKLSFEFMTDWISNPQDFRPTTRMPRFFGLWNHLDGDGLAEAKKYEPVEIRSVTEYLLKASQPFEYANVAADEPDHQAAVQRGKKVFATRGCLACHQHADFKKSETAEWKQLLEKVPGDLKDKDYPRTEPTQGPDLSRIGAKLALSKDGWKWLYSWVKEPSRYHSRTFMPNLFLDPIKDADGKTTDPAADLTDYLMNSQQGWKPDAKYVLKRPMSDDEEKALADLAQQYLSDKFPGERAEDYIRNGIPVSQASVVAGDEAELINPKRLKGTDDLTLEDAAQKKESPEEKEARLARLTQYVGRRTVGKYGCYGCHDIPGYEDAKPIGTALADWGRKLPSRLAFEQISEYVTHYPKGLHAAATAPKTATENKPATGTAASASSEQPEFSLSSLPENEQYFMEKLLGEEREGFLWQKLREPRSYDFRKTENKKYNERLRMPKFHFAVEETQNLDKIEQVMTFVLGLVSEPPPPAFVNHPTSAKQDIYAGRKVLEKFNCTGCHILDMERWDVEFKSAKTDFGPVPSTPDFPFVKAHFTEKEIADSKLADRRSLQKASLVGMPKVKLNGSPDISDSENEDTGVTTTACTMLLFQPALIGGDARPVSKSIDVPLNDVTRRYPAWGGELARYVLPLVVADEPDYKQKPNEAWGWLPPPLVGEGKKVQSGWLHDFLLNPFPIRPAASLRMPRFNMSSAEASQLAAYFAAVDGAEYPYEYDPRITGEALESKEMAFHGKYLDTVLGLVTDNQFCIKCHKVGDFSPTGNPKAMAPRLDRVHARLRPDYIHRWLGNPPAILPYTGMPVNFPPPPAPPVAQNLLPGTSEQQIDSIVDLLMDFDRYAQNQMSIKSRIKPAAPAASPPQDTNPAESPDNK